MPAFICTACGTQYPDSAGPPKACTICEEERQYVPPTGQSWTTLQSLAARHFNSFRQSLGYVPQKDIVHTGLSVARALYYTARLRLPTDTGPAELQARLEEVIELMELGPHRDTLVAAGQRAGVIGNVNRSIAGDLHMSMNRAATCL